MGVEYGGLLTVLSRVSASLLASYAFTWGFVTLGVAGLVALGVGFHDAELSMLLLAFPLLLALFLRALVARRPLRVSLPLGGGAALLILVALAMQHFLLNA